VSVRIVLWALAPLFAILLVLRLGSLIDAVAFRLRRRRYWTT